MKKRIWIVIVLIMMLVLNPCYALGESKDEYYRQINDGLNSLETALDSNNLGAAESALRDISSAVYAAAHYLAQIGEYDKSVLQIMDNAKAAKNAATGDYSTYLEQAREINSALFGHSGGEPGGEPNYGHEHRCSEWVIITPATCTTKGVASGVCDSGVILFSI